MIVVLTPQRLKRVEKASSCDGSASQPTDGLTMDDMIKRVGSIAVAACIATVVASAAASAQRRTPHRQPHRRQAR